MSSGTGLLADYSVTVSPGHLTVRTGLAAESTIHDKLYLLLANSDDIGTYFNVMVQMLDKNGKMKWKPNSLSPHMCSNPLRHLV